MAVQAEDLVAGLGVPDLHLLVGMHREKAGDRGEAAAVGAERHPLDGSGVVAAEGELFLAGLRVPQLHCPDRR